MTTGLDPDRQAKDLVRRLIERIQPFESCAVAFSGGVDSAVVARAAHEALGPRALAVTGVSPSLAAGELDGARRIAAQIGIRHRVVETQEAALPAYQRNDSRRCFHCKTQLYTMIEGLRSDENFQVVLSGTNADDLSDYRPGLTAADHHGVRHPLAECGATKVAVRELARFWNLHVWNKPAAPCLASRIAYGVEVTEQRLRAIDLAEQFLKSLGVEPLRVRLHSGELARIEVSPEQLTRLSTDPLRLLVASRLAELGFRFVTLDLIGFRSGSLNTMLQIQPAHPQSPAPLENQAETPSASHPSTPSRIS